MDFDTLIDRRGTNSSKWDGMEKSYGVSPDDGLAMWVADMDFRSPDCVQDAVAAMHARGNYGYLANNDAYKAAIGWWMQNRHGWRVPAEDIFTTFGLCNAVGLCLQTFTDPGDGIVLFTPVYHAFARTIRAAGRAVVECPLSIDETGLYRMNFDAYDSQMTGGEKMLILCSPHNPGGRVWTQDELKAVAAFAERHNLLLVCDEIHHDLVYARNTHVPMPVAAPECLDRLIMLTASSKTFNLAGEHCGNVIIHDPELKKQFAATQAALAMSPPCFGIAMVTAAYSPAGAEWVDALVNYLDGNRQVLDKGINAIPGLKSMPMQSTYLAWVDFAGTGMEREEFIRRVQQDARIAANHGTTFGLGGETFLRFNFGTQRSRVEEAVSRLTDAFSDLQ